MEESAGPAGVADRAKLRSLDEETVGVVGAQKLLEVE